MGPRQRATVPPHSAVTLWTRKPPPYRLTGKMSEASRGLGQQGLPEAAPTLRNEGRNTNPAFREKPFTERAVNGALSICQTSLGD